ncbi:DUF505 family protein [Thermosulfuriphilus sp.]
MILTIGHLRTLRRLENRIRGQKIAGLDQTDHQRLIHLCLSGLVFRDGEDFGLTRSGQLILETFEQLERRGFLELDGRDEEYRLLSSRIISMLEVANRAQGRTDFSASINQALEERGLAREGRLQPLALSILEAYRSAVVSLAITPSLAQSLKKMPPGPGRKSLLVDIPDEHLLELEAQRLMVFSIPEGVYYSLTGVGNQIRAALRAGLVPEITIDQKLLQDLLEDRATETLKALGAVDETGGLTYPGKHLLNAAQLFFEPITVNPALDLDPIDLTVLESLSGHKTEGFSPESLKERLENAGLRDEVRIRQALYRLEGFALLKRSPSGRLRPTNLGARLLNEGDLRQAPVDAREVMALTTTRMENLSPDEAWIRLAESHRSLGQGYPSKRGQCLAEVASRIERLPVITAEELKTLRKLPLWRGFSQEELLATGIDSTEETARALRRLIASGLVDVWPGLLYTLSPAGEKVKQGLAGVPDGVVFPLTPHIWRLLLALRAVGRSRPGGRKIKIHEDKIQEALQLSGLGPEAFSEALETARLCRYVSGYDILEPGVLLLEGLDLLKHLVTRWEEIMAV